MIISILLGILGLGIVILVHETGHFFAARAAGIEVETFSIGWGPKLLSWKRGKTEYRVSAFPIGGYCKMKGEHVLREAWQSGKDTIPKEPGSFFSAEPWKRIAVSVAGPAANLFFAVVVLSIIWLAGFEIQTYSNKIIPLEGEVPYPAERAGLQEGDRIVELDGKEVRHYRDLREIISASADETISLTFQRGERLYESEITPEMDPSTGIGKIGVYAWIDPVIGSVVEGSSADQAGLRGGDRILRANGKEIRHTVDFIALMEPPPDTLTLELLRGGEELTAEVGPEIGITFEALTYRSPRIGPLRAIGKGAAETASTMALTVKSIGLLFRGVNLRESLSGPIRITYYVGEVASQSFRAGIGSGFSNMFRFLSLLSVAIFFMNLLPIPALDGGMVLLFLIEIIRGKSLKPKVIYRYQSIGITLILALFLFATFNDVFFLIKR
jgi:regulator of sigma E protease